jgi:hypothetical protein
VRKSFGSVQAVRGVALTGLFAVSRPVGEVLERAGITAIAGRAVGKCSGENSSGCASPWH